MLSPLSVPLSDSIHPCDHWVCKFPRSLALLSQNLGPSDSPALLRLSLLASGTYDAATKAGGFSGAILTE